MTFEQLDNERNANKKKRKKLEQEKNEQFWLEKQVLHETSDLLHELAQKISREFGIDILEAKELIQGDTSHNLESLKHLTGAKNNINVFDLKNAVDKAKTQIEDLSKKKRESLKQSLEKNIFRPEEYNYTLSRKVFSEAIRNRALHPQSITDQCIGLGLGLIDSTEAIIFFGYNLSKGIMLTPYHIYLMIMGKASYRGFSKI